ncbi:hypothetical protein FEE96_08435 [Parasedimentitalea maritima]|uniref:HEAT repeat domain-containing protein n=2 Tax=Parasedimentitalea maritima TaxID=2578117 RepID=A0ABY2UY29_9RHOB|nr:hypothetical protein FEE96_08435 [Zongyanglinia marina]
MRHPMLADPIRTTDITSAILPHVQSENEVIRCAAVRALGRNGQDDPRSREVLLELIRDGDPDIRSDAIEALAPLAQAKDVDMILESLQADPVREVKLAAIQILVALKDTKCIPQLRALALSKCEDSVVWEDEIADWDDWMDIQIAAINALGTLGASDSIDDLLAALNDEMGQTLDIPVFRALAQLGQQGLVWLLATVEAGKGLARKRAADALADVDPDLLRPHLDRLTGADDVALRLLGLSLLSADDPKAEQLTLQDVSQDLRLAGLVQFAQSRPEWVIAALADPSERVQATALEQLELPLPDYLHDMLVDNILAWLLNGGAVLTPAAATLLPKVAPQRAAGPLNALASDADRPIEARLAAIRGLGGIGGPAMSEILGELLADRSQQVRLVALHEIKALAQAGDHTALDILVHAIGGTQLDEEDKVQVLNLGVAPDVGTPKEDAPSNLRISEEGEILQEDPAESDVPATGSTLAALQFVTPEAEAQAAKSKPKGKKNRVAIEGPDAVGEDLSCAAIEAARALGSVRVAAAVASQITASSDRIRIASWRALTTGFPSCFEAAQAAPMALCDASPEVRREALKVLILADQLDRYLLQALEDQDALVRADAVAQLSDERLLPFISDTAVSVRHAALSTALDSGDKNLSAQAIAQVFSAGRVDTLAWALKRSDDMQAEAVRRLNTGEEGRANFIILDALAAS